MLEVGVVHTMQSNQVSLENIGMYAIVLYDCTFDLWVGFTVTAYF